MATSDSSFPVTPKPVRSAAYRGCLTVFAVLLGIQGTWNAIGAVATTLVVVGAPLISLASLAFLLTLVGSCFINILLSFRLRHHHWLVSLGLFGLAWVVLPALGFSLANAATMRLRNDSRSMDPSLPSGSYFIVDRQAYQHRGPQRGDIVVYRFPLDTSRRHVSRIIGLPGEQIDIEQGQVSIHGVPLNEAYLVEPAAGSGSWKVGDGQYFVLGDNRDSSSDSRMWGTVPREHIVGEVVWIYWPLVHLGKTAEINYGPSS